MGLVFEELIRKFAELSNETAGEHFTPREVIRLMVNLLFIEDDDVLTKPGVVRTIYDPTAGTGGMLSVAGEHLAEHEPEGPADDVRAGAEPRVLRHLQGRHAHQGAGHRQHHLRQHALRRRPPAQASSTTCSPIRRSAWSGRRSRRRSARSTSSRASTAASAPACRASVDGSLLFLLHLISKMRPADDGGSRFGIVLNGSPLFTGGAGSGESEIRRYVLENDLVEAIIGLPTDMFYNTGISTYVWIVSNRKPAHRKGKVQLIDASGFWQKMRKSLGSKRKELSPEHIEEITRLFGEFQGRPTKDGVPHQPHLQERGLRLPHHHRRAPARDAKGKIVLGTKGKQKGKPQPGRQPARHRERAAERGRGNLLQARGAAARARCLDRPREDQGRLRNPVQPAFLRLQAAAPAGRDRRRVEAGHRPHHDDDRGAVGMSFPRYREVQGQRRGMAGRGAGALGVSSRLKRVSSQIMAMGRTQAEDDPDVFVTMASSSMAYRIDRRCDLRRCDAIYLPKRIVLSEHLC